MKATNRDKSPTLKVSGVIVKAHPRYYRPTEVETLLGSPTKAKKELGWVPKITAQEICAGMVESNLTEERRQTLLKQGRYNVNVAREW